MARLSKKPVSGAEEENKQTEDFPNDVDAGSTRVALLTGRSREHMRQSSKSSSSSSFAIVDDLVHEDEAEELEGERVEESQDEELQEDEDDTEEDSEGDYESGDSEYSDLSDFIVDDSASDDELRRGNARSPRKAPRRLVRKSPGKTTAPTTTKTFNDDSEDEVRVLKETKNQAIIRLSPGKSRIVDSESEESGKENVGVAAATIPPTQPDNTKKRAEDGIMKKLADHLGGALRLSPPREEQGSKQADDNAAATTAPSGVTPPESPSRRLKSPIRKNLANIPQSPHRQSVDAFWSQSNVDEWNEQHSPKKAPRAKNRLLPIFLSPTKPKSPRRLVLDSDDEEFLSSSEETEKGWERGDDKGPSIDSRSNRLPIRQKTSPKKANDATNKLVPESCSPYGIATAADRNRFKKTGRYELAREFLAELISRVSVASIGDGSRTRLDQFQEKICDGTGGGSGDGIPITWSRTLNKTAGRAQLRLQKRRDNNEAVAKSAVMSIELAEKVLDRPEYVMNTVAHEFAHLCNMVETPRAPAHGAGFFSWARRIEKSIKRRPLPPAMDKLGVDVHITTRHNYDIDFKYVWACMECGKQVGRHTKSLAAGSFHRPDGGIFQLIKPRPRATGATGAGTCAGDSPTKENAWQVFRKENFNAVKQELSASRNGKVQLGEIMSVLSERWKKNKGIELKSAAKSSPPKEDANTEETETLVADDAEDEVAEIASSGDVADIENEQS